LFKLDPRLVESSSYICELELSQVRLNHDGDLDWFILIPRRESIVEWTDLTHGDQLILLSEINFISKLLKVELNPSKLNIANLGNMVKQFHLHIIARYHNDRAFPQAIWGTKEIKPFNEQRVEFWKKVIERKINH
jgi:diadenosine tetraphosphate (Ap4A) HIT family hydrolase